MAGDCGGRPRLGKSVGPLATGNIAVGRAPNGGDVPAETLEVVSDF